MAVLSEKHGLWAKSLVILTLGFCPLFAQTLLFRSFLTVFDGNELSLGMFFFSWLVWVAVGAVVGRAMLPTGVSTHFEVLLFLFLPAILFQFFLFQNLRGYLGFQAYELVSLYKISLITMIANAPVSFLTGFLFMLACKWSKGVVAASRVYVLEALGSFLGAIMVTVLLYLKFMEETLFIVNAVVLAGNSLIFLVFMRCFRQKVVGSIFKITLASLAVAIGLSLLLLGGNERWAHFNNQRQWHYLLPKGTYNGSFVTHDAKYCYGEYADEFVVMAWNSVVESWPERETALEHVADWLSHNPNSETVLVIGQGVWAEVYQLCKLKQIKRIVWLDADKEYPQTIRRLFEKQQRLAVLGKLVTPTVDARHYLQHTQERFDTTVLMYPDAATLLMNRYSTKQFFQLIRSVATTSSVLCVYFTGAENTMGIELAFTGASLYCTLKQVFDNIVLKPGELSTFFASNSVAMPDSPKEIMNNYLMLKQLPGLFPAEALVASYSQERIIFQMNRYFDVIGSCPERLLVNSDEHPKSFLYSLLFMLKKMGLASFSMHEFILFFKLLLPLLTWALFVYFFCRLIYIHWGVWHVDNSTSCSTLWSFDLYSSLMLASFAGMVLNVILICEYQIVFGSVFLNFGLISSLFMIGLFGGGLLTRWYMAGKQFFLRPLVLVAFSIVAFSLLILGMPLVVHEGVYCALFFGAGFFSGMFFPVVAAALSEQVSTERYTLFLEMLDHLGGAVGALVTTVILLPILGIENTLLIVTLLMVGVFVIATFGRRRKMEKIKRNNLFSHIIRPFVFCCVGSLLFVCVAWYIVHSTVAVAAEPTGLSDNQVKQFVGGIDKLFKKTRLINGQLVTYYEIKDLLGKLEGYVFYSKDFAADVKGYGGTISMIIKTDKNGIVNNFKVLKSNETKGFIERVMKKKDLFLNKDIFHPDNKPFDAVSGATITAEAVYRTLQESGKGFFALINKSVKKLEQSKLKSLPASEPPPATIREINEKTYQKLIKQKRVSPKKAKYYRQLQ